jgi:ABC-type branched-subunit amino acid transport system ATPase component
VADKGLRVENLGVSYGGVQAVDGLSLSVSSGTCVAIVGANGAGKTSLLRGLSGLARTTPSTSIWLAGEQIDRRSAANRARRGLGHVLEGRHLFLNLTVRDNLMLGLAVSRKHSDKAALDPVCDLLPDVRKRLNLRAGQLSGGQQQLVAIARALVGNPSVLLLDEPTVGLAPVLITQVSDVIRQVVGRGSAVLLVEQRLAVVRAVAETVHVLVHGRIRVSTSVSDPSLDQIVTSAYLS